MHWLTFAYSLPSGKKSSARVALWRRLQRLGAIAPAGNMYLLPQNEDCQEAFLWLAQEVEQAGGGAIVGVVEKFVGSSDEGLIDLFNQARDAEYQVLVDEAEALFSAETPNLPPQLRKLRSQQRDIQRIDYFNNQTGQTLQQLLQKLEARLMVPKEIEIEGKNSADFQQKIWRTRPKPHVDRLASIWLIRRFIDAEAQIVFGESDAETITFDMPNADFGHVGTLCTFEAMRAAFGIDVQGLQQLAEIVHEIDLRDGRYFHPETIGLDAVLQGWRESEMSDSERMQHGLRLFDGVLTTLAGQA